MPGLKTAAYNPDTMRRIKETLQLFVAAIVVAGLPAFGLPAVVSADTVDEPSLVISQFKITSHNGQFVTLYNTTDNVLDMSQYKLEYFNNYDPAKATSSRAITLLGIVPPHGYFMASNGSMTLCYQLTINSISLGFSTSSGTIRVLHAGSSAGSAPALEDYASWSKTDVDGAQTLPADDSAFLMRQPVDEANNPLVAAPGTGDWQTVRPDDASPCDLVSDTDGSSVPTGLNQLLPSTEPPATFGGGGYSAGATDSLPEDDIGLMAPLITELLPNPAGSGNDSTDEFIELYNPNDVAFNLTGFVLQTGTTSLHNYTLPAGSSLPPKGFAVFYSAATGLSLSNTASQARLLDPGSNVIATTELYNNAQDGLAWALADGKWYWTMQPTPGKPNVINLPSTTSKKSAKSSAKQKAASKKAKSKKTKPKAAKKHKAKKAKHKKAKTSLATKQTADRQTLTPVHPWVLALVGTGAILYGTYEYRADLANHVYKFRNHFKARRGSGR